MANLLERPSPAPPPATLSPACLATVVSGLSALAVALMIWNFAPDLTSTTVAICGGLALLVVGEWTQAALAWRKRSQSVKLWKAGDYLAARRSAASARDWAWGSVGFAAFLAIAIAIVVFLTASNSAVSKIFFRWDLIREALPETAKALTVNVVIAIGAELLSDLLGLSLAIARLLPGRSAWPLRFLAVGYIDLFRGLPAIVVIYLIAFGIPIARIPMISDAPPVVYAVAALSLTYSAYKAELFRSGIESVHTSQASAALSLGLSRFHVMRLIILPQVLRRLAPAMLSNFISLQKDTALVNVVGIVDAFTQGKIYATFYFNLSPVIAVCILFVVITIPQTRLVDYMIARSDRQTQGSR